MQPTLTLRGVEVYQACLSRTEQVDLLDEIREVVRRAPLFSPMTPYGKPMSVQMTSAGKYGWFSDRGGYRYERRHPEGQPWPPIPAAALAVWRALVSDERDPDCCLVNLYRGRARMGLHQDRDETDFSWPVLSISLGDDGLFRVGGTKRSGSTGSVWLRSGDALLLRGEARLVYHGIDRIRPGSCDLLSGGGRLNLTMRVVD
jgi:alkylated DNA repair protein (DNA oxidative demethylase)